jgi:tRNA(Ile)-lysidine synthase
MPVADTRHPRDISPKGDGGGSNIWLWRPLLHEPREAIDAYVQTLGLEPIEDPSNAETTMRRNVLRHEVVPVLEAHFPGASSALARYAALAAEDDRALADVANAIFDLTVDPGGLLDSRRLRNEPLAIQRRVIRRWLTGVTGFTELTAERTDAVLSFALTESGGKALEIGAGWTVHLVRGMLRADRATDSSRSHQGEAQ